MQFWGNYLSPGFFLFRFNNLSILSSHLINSRGAIAEAIFGPILVFINQRIWIVLGRCLFRLRSVHTFSWFLKSTWSSNFGLAETGSGAKSEWFCGVKFFGSNLKVEWENGVWTKIRFLASCFLFTFGNFTLIFTVFFRFLGSDFYLNSFPNPFIVCYMPRFFSVWAKGHFIASDFFVRMRHFDIDFFLSFRSDFFGNGFPKSLLVRYGSIFLFSQWKFVELYVRTCPVMFFISSSRFLLRSYEVTTTSNLLLVHSFLRFHLNCVRNVIVWS